MMVLCVHLLILKVLFTKENEFLNIWVISPVD